MVTSSLRCMLTNIMQQLEEVDGQSKCSQAYKAWQRHIWIIILTQDSKAPVWSLPDMNFPPNHHHLFYYWSGKLIPLVKFNCQYVNGKKALLWKHLVMLTTLQPVQLKRTTVNLQMWFFKRKELKFSPSVSDAWVKKKIILLLSDNSMLLGNSRT